MNRMKTVLGLQCNCCILLGRITRFCLVWTLVRRGLAGLAEVGRHFFILEFSWAEILSLAI